MLESARTVRPVSITHAASLRTNKHSTANRSDKVYWLVTDGPAKDCPEDEFLHGRFWWEKKTFIGMSSYQKAGSCEEIGQLTLLYSTIASRRTAWSVHTIFTRAERSRQSQNKAFKKMIVVKEEII